MADDVVSIAPSDHKEQDADTLITFHYAKSQLFREIHASGAYGAVTPGFGLRMCFYSQHVPDPNVQVYKLAESGTLAELLTTEPPTGGGVIIREVEIAITVDLTTASALAKWLQDQIKQAQEQMGVETPGTEEASEAHNAEDV